MDFYQLVRYIRQLGCKVILHDRKELRVNKCEGTFTISKRGNPVISLAMRAFDNDSERILTLLHEFAHFVQWKIGYWDRIHDETDGWGVVDQYLKNTRTLIPKEEIKKARRTVLLLEYDAELRTISLARYFGIPINEEEYLQWANNYMLQIKWALETREWRYPKLDHKISKKVSSVKNLLAPLTKEEKKIIEG